MNILNRISLRTKILIVAAIVIVLIANTIYVSNSRAGKTRVLVEVVPSNAQIFVNDQQSKAGVIYLEPGEYTFTAKAKGFQDDKRVVTIGKEPTEVGLLPETSSDEAYELFKNDPELQQRREAIGGKKAASTNTEMQDQTPLLSALPYTDIYGPFKIDFGAATYRPNGVFIQISDSSPAGREKALKWMREQGQDLTDLEIRYSDFVNPLKGVSQDEHDS